MMDKAASPIPDTAFPGTGSCPALDARNVSWYAGRQPIIKDISLCIHPGELLGLIGPNGSGKSSLLRILAGIFSPTQGSIHLHGHNLRKLGRKQIARQIALVSQSADTLDSISVWDAVALGRTPWLSAWQNISRQDERIVSDALSSVGMLEKHEHPWEHLSGGERQRVHIARAIAQQPQVLLLDEPNNHLDIHQQLALMDLVQGLNITKVMALHDLNQSMCCDRLAVLHHGTLRAIGKPDNILQEDILQDVFQVRATELFDPSDHKRILRFYSLPGATHSPRAQGTQNIQPTPEPR